MKIKTIIVSLIILLLGSVVSLAYAEGRRPVNARVMRDPAYLLKKDNIWPGTQIFGELRAGTSTYGISGNITLGSTETDGRIGEIGAASSPIVQLPALTSALPVVILTDVTTAGDDSGVTIWSNDGIKNGTGAGHTSGDTLFVNSGNTGFSIVVKALSYGGTLAWKVWSVDATVKRP